MTRCSQREHRDGAMVQSARARPSPIGTGEPTDTRKGRDAPEEPLRDRVLEGVLASQKTAL
ncbi:MAG: hypothetical protein KME30_12710 [Iphinoe sp. HA4291-MV1]|jgi:hypothetical protein|nr:hypothetical protein [Iphinoe sp. HA4291-MV1]